MNVCKCLMNSKQNLVVDVEKVQHYYVRNAENHPFGVVALYQQKDEETGNMIYSRGISICHENDRFDKKVGKKRAFSMLKRAVGMKVSSCPIIHLANMSFPTGNINEFMISNQTQGIKASDLGIIYAAGYNIKLTFFEAKMLRDE